MDGSPPPPDLAERLARAGVISHVLRLEPAPDAGGPPGPEAEAALESAFVEALGRRVPGDIFRLGPLAFGIDAGPSGPPPGLAAALLAELPRGGAAALSIETPPRPPAAAPGAEILDALAALAGRLAAVEARLGLGPAAPPGEAAAGPPAMVAAGPAPALPALLAALAAAEARIAARLDDLAARIDAIARGPGAAAEPPPCAGSLLGERLLADIAGLRLVLGGLRSGLRDLDRRLGRSGDPGADPPGGAGSGSPEDH